MDQSETILYGESTPRVDDPELTRAAGQISRYRSSKNSDPLQRAREHQQRGFSLRSGFWSQLVCFCKDHTFVFTYQDGSKTCACGRRYRSAEQLAMQAQRDAEEKERDIQECLESMLP